MRKFVFTPDNQKDCEVTAWLQEKAETVLPAIVICPGGAYAMVSDREGTPVAEKFYEAGYHVFVLKYSVGKDARGFKPLSQLADTIAQIRKKAKEWYVLPEQIAVCGFSAGGHLAASLGVLHNKQEFLRGYSGKTDIRPNAMILCYPVITSDEFANVASIENVSGSEKGTELYKWFGLTQHVDSETPPAFIWHTAEDKGVPVENSLQMAAALSAAKIPFELEIFPKGPHGMSICTKEVGTECPYNARWVENCIMWLEMLWKVE